MAVMALALSRSTSADALAVTALSRSLLALATEARCQMASNANAAITTMRARDRMDMSEDAAGIYAAQITEDACQQGIAIHQHVHKRGAPRNRV